jgi:hypothetical protein
MKKMKEKSTVNIFTVFVLFVCIYLLVDSIYLCGVVNTVVKETQSKYPIPLEQLSRTQIECTIYPEGLSDHKSNVLFTFNSYAEHKSVYYLPWTVIRNTNRMYYSSRTDTQDINTMYYSPWTGTRNTNQM